MPKFILALIFLITACTVTPAATSPSLPPNFLAEVVVEKLNSPTQMIVAPNDKIWIAELNGGENDGQGRIIAVSLNDSKREVVLSGLLKPTGIAIANNYLWIASQRTILRAPLNTKGEVGQTEIVLANLPFNGRSNGTLTVSPKGMIIYETSGMRIGNNAEEGSAQLWELDPRQPSRPRLIATGLKNAYAHVFDNAGRLWVTDVAEDLVNDTAPPDELNWIIEGADYGWPACFAERQPALNYGGSDSICAATRAAVAVFPPHSTPTSVAVSPWETDTLLVALWGPTQPSVVKVKLAISGETISSRTLPFITGIKAPQHLLVLPDRSLLVSDHLTGTLYRITSAP